MPASPFASTPAEQVALETILEERHGMVNALSERLAAAVDELSQPCQGWVVTEREADDPLDRLRDEFVGRMMDEMEPWEEDEDLRGTVVDLVTRQLFTAVREAFVRWLLRARLN